MSRTLAIALESIGICAIIVGISIEAILHAPVGFIVISGGAATIAIGSLLWMKIYRRK